MLEGALRLNARAPHNPQTGQLGQKADNARRGIKT